MITLKVTFKLKGHRVKTARLKADWVARSNSCK